MGGQPQKNGSRPRIFAFHEWTGLAVHGWTGGAEGAAYKTKTPASVRGAGVLQSNEAFFFCLRQLILALPPLLPLSILI